MPECGDGAALGYWFGPSDYPIDAAPILRFDRKGAFSLLPGNGIAEAILTSAADGDDRRFAELRDHLDRHGLHIVPTLVAAIRLPICSPTPQTVYEQLLATYIAKIFRRPRLPNPEVRSKFSQPRDIWVAGGQSGR